MIKWIRLGLEGRSFRATLRLYLLGILGIAPVAAVIGILFGAPKAFQYTPLLVAILVGCELIVSLFSSSLHFWPFQSQQGDAHGLEDRRRGSTNLANLVNLHVATGDLHVARGDTRLATESYEQALRLAHEGGDLSTVAIVIANMTKLKKGYRAQSDTRSATRSYEQVLVIAHKIGDRRVAEPLEQSFERERQDRRREETTLPRSRSSPARGTNPFPFYPGQPLFS